MGRSGLGSTIQNHSGNMTSSFAGVDYIRSFATPQSKCSTTLYLAYTHDMSLLWHPGQQKVLQEFAVSLGLANGLLLEPSACCCSSGFRPNGHGKLLSPLVVGQLWLNLHTENIFCPHIYGCFCWLSHIFLRRSRTTKPTQQGELRGKKLILSRANAAEILSYFVVCANTKPLGASA